MVILGLLADQVELLLENGQTNEDKFLDDLESQHLPALRPSARCEEVNALYNEVRESITGDMLCVSNAGFEFDVQSIRRLRAKEWLNDQIILACLSLSDKLPFVRVGFSVPFHQQTRPKIAMQHPFQKAASQISRWHRQLEREVALVCFFPLLLHGNHFALLEINEREDRIYYYDSMAKEENVDVKVCDQAGIQKIELTP